MDTLDPSKKQYVVLTKLGHECMLGYTDPDFPYLFGVLSCSILRGYSGDIHIWSIPRHLISSWRFATKQDFIDYRVSTNNLQHDPALVLQP